MFCDACSFLARIPAWFCFHSKVFGAVATATATATATYLYGGGVLVAALVVLLFDEVSVVVFCTFCFVVALLRIKTKKQMSKKLNARSFISVRFRSALSGCVALI